MEAVRESQFASSHVPSDDVRDRNTATVSSFNPSTRLVMIGNTAPVVVVARVSAVSSALIAVVPGVVATVTVVAMIIGIVVTEVARVNDGKAWVVATAGPVESSSLVAGPVAVVKSMRITMAIAVAIAVVVRIPANAPIVVIEPGNGVSAVSAITERSPDPTVDAVVAPVTVMFSVPTPRVVGYPCPSVAIDPNPVAVLVRNPVRHVMVRNKITNASNCDPAAVTGKGVVFVYAWVVIGRRLSDNFGRRLIGAFALDNSCIAKNEDVFTGSLAA